MNNTQTLEETQGYSLAISFKPFIDPKCTEHLEIVKDIARSINRVLNRCDAEIKELVECLRRNDTMIATLIAHTPESNRLNELNQIAKQNYYFLSKYKLI